MPTPGRSRRRSARLPTRPSRRSTRAGLAATGADRARRRRCRPQVLRRAQRLPATSFRSIGKAASIAQGTTPIVVAWDYNALAWRDGFAGNPQTEIVVPTDRRRRRRLHPGDQRLRAASERCQALDGIPLLGRRPARLARAAIATRSASTTWRPTARSRRSCSTRCPPADAYAKAVFPTLDEQNAAKEVHHRPVGCRRRRQRPSNDGTSLLLSSYAAGPVSTGPAVAPRATGWRQTLTAAGASARRRCRSSSSR